jgi:hypothetical protein
MFVNRSIQRSFFNDRFVDLQNNLAISGSVAERTKAMVLGISLFGGAGSNPIASIILSWSYQLFNVFFYL